MAPVDFDLSFQRERFFSPYTGSHDRELFDSWMESEHLELERALAGETANTGMGMVTLNTVVRTSHSWTHMVYAHTHTHIHNFTCAYICVIVYIHTHTHTELLSCAPSIGLGFQGYHVARLQMCLQETFTGGNNKYQPPAPAPSTEDSH